MSVNAKATITEVYCAFTQKQDIRSSVFVCFHFTSGCVYDKLLLMIGIIFYILWRR